MVYESEGGSKGALLSGRDFPIRDEFVCGDHGDELCEAPTKALLKINLSEPKNLTAVYVEMSGMPDTQTRFHSCLDRDLTVGALRRFY